MNTTVSNALTTMLRTTLKFVRDAMYPNQKPSSDKKAKPLDREYLEELHAGTGKDLRERIGRNIKFLRTSNGQKITQGELVTAMKKSAEAVGDDELELSTAGVCKVEQGDYKAISASFLQHCARALGVSVAELVV